MKHIYLIFTLVLFSINMQAVEKRKNNTKFSFAYFTDIHLNNGNNRCFQGFEKAVSHAKATGIDFIMTGGDNVDIDGFKGDEKTAHELYKKYAQAIENSGTTFYLSIGNHDRFWADSKDNSLYNEGMFEEYFHKSYYSFDHKGWHFIVLNTSNSVVDEVQKQWLADDLAKVDAKTPIIVSVHVPFLSVYYPVLYGEYTSKDTFSNFKEIWEMFEEKNLKLVLQGHMHLYEEIKVRGVQFITAGAISANWWGGSYYGTEEGYLKVEIDGNDFSWEYIDYGWEVNQE